MQWTYVPPDDGNPEYWYNTETGQPSFTNPTRASFGNPWAGDFSGWDAGNYGAIFSAANPYGMPNGTDVYGRLVDINNRYNIRPEDAVNAFRQVILGRYDGTGTPIGLRNPYLSGATPEAFIREYESVAGNIAGIPDAARPQWTPERQALAKQQDQQILASQNQDDGGGLGDLLGIASLVGGGLGLAGLAGLGPFASAGGLSAGAGLTEAGWGFGAGGLGLDAGLTGAATAGGTLGGGMDWWNTDWGIETMPFTTDPRFAGTTVDGVTQGPWGSGDAADWWAQDSSADWMSQWEGGTPEIGTPTPNGSGWPNLPPGMGQLLSSILGPAAGSLIGGALSGSGSSSIWDMFGKLLPAGLGMYASNQQANKLSELAQKYQDFGAPYRQKLAEISADPNAFYNSEGAQKATDTVLRKLSIGGNPAGSANKQALTIDSLYDQYGKERDRLAGFGGLTNYNQAAPQLETQAIGANANMWNAAGAGLNDIFNPKPSLSELFKQMKTAGAF